MQTIGHQFNIYYLNEGAVTIEFGNDINEQLLQQITAFNQLLNQNRFPGFYTSVSAYTTLSVFFDPLQVIMADDLAGSNCFDKVSAYLQSLNKTSRYSKLNDGETMIIPVCYGGELGPDLDEVAYLNNLSKQQVIALHSNAVYKIYMIGFVPGFAYMGGMANAIATPRKTTPRQAIPAGSVGIAGNQTGIYPLQTPGGWQIIGQTPLKILDVSREQPALLKAGDNVVFKPISEQEFNQLSTG